MRSEIQKVAWRAYWPVTVLAVTFLLVVALLGTYLTARQHLADARAERQRAAMCAVLANIPGRVPAEIAHARVVYAPPGHPGQCNPIKGAAIPKPTPIPVFINGTPATIIVRPAPDNSSSPQPTRPRAPAPTPTRTATPTPTPTPTPTRLCVQTICLPPEASVVALPVR